MPRIACRKAHIKGRDELRSILLAQQAELNSRVGQGIGRLITLHDPDDEGGMATENYAKDQIAGTLDRERRTLIEIKKALTRLNAGTYGICEDCNIRITRARIEALPWARLCVACAERSQAA